MAIDVTGISSSLTPINRPEPKAPEIEQGPTPVLPTEPINPRAPRQDVEIEATLAQPNATSRALVQEGSDIGTGQQERGERLAQLNAERERRVEGGNNPAEQDESTQNTVETLQRIRENAQSAPFGNGVEDVGPLEANAFFIRGDTTELDSAISALERQSELDGARLEEVRQSFNETRDQQLSPGVTPIQSEEEAVELTARVGDQIQQEAATDLNGLTTEDRSNVLKMLQI